MAYTVGEVAMSYIKGILFRLDRKRALFSPAKANPIRERHRRTASPTLKTSTLSAISIFFIISVSIDSAISFFGKIPLGPVNLPEKYPWIQTLAVSIEITEQGWCIQNVIRNA